MKVIILFLSMVFVSPAYSFEGGGGPCREDMEKLCGQVEPGKGSKIKCLIEKKAEASEQCQAYMDRKSKHMKKAMKEIAEACQGDVETHCADIQGGKGRLMKCLRDNKDKISEACKSELEQKREKRKKK